MSGAADALAQLRQALSSGAINQATYDIAAAALGQPAGGGAVAQGPGATALGQGAAQVQGDNRGTINLGLIIEQASLPGASAEVLQQAYLARLLRDLNQLPLLAGEEGGEQVQLACVYTALLTLRNDRDGRASTPDQQRDNQSGFKPDSKPLSALAVLNAEPRLVLMAGPGGGKSTFVNVVAMALAGERLALPQPNLATLTAPLPEDDEQSGRQHDEVPEPQPWHHGPLLPVLVVLRDLAAQLPPPGTPVDADTVWTYIAGQLKRRALEAYAPHLHQQLLQHGGLVMFDGLDEVPDAQQRRAQVKQAVQAFAATFHYCRLLVTSRTYAYQHQAWKLDGFAEVQLRPFNQAQMAAFIDAWYSHMASLARLTEVDARERAGTLKSEIQRNPRLHELAERPLLLTLIAQLQSKGGGALPQRREALYDAAVTMLLDTWEKLKPRPAPHRTARPTRNPA